MRSIDFEDSSPQTLINALDSGRDETDRSSLDAEQIKGNELLIARNNLGPLIGRHTRDSHEWSRWIARRDCCRGKFDKADPGGR